MAVSVAVARHASGLVPVRTRFRGPDVPVRVAVRSLASRGKRGPALALLIAAEILPGARPATRAFRACH